MSSSRSTACLDRAGDGVDHRQERLLAAPSRAAAVRLCFLRAGALAGAAAPPSVGAGVPSPSTVAAAGIGVAPTGSDGRRRRREAALLARVRRRSDWPRFSFIELGASPDSRSADFFERKSSSADCTEWKSAYTFTGVRRLARLRRRHDRDSGTSSRGPATSTSFAAFSFSALSRLRLLDALGCCGGARRRAWRRGRARRAAPANALPLTSCESSLSMVDIRRPLVCAHGAAVGQRAQFFELVVEDVILGRKGRRVRARRAKSTCARATPPRSRDRRTSESWGQVGGISARDAGRPTFARMVTYWRRRVHARGGPMQSDQTLIQSAETLTRQMDDIMQKPEARHHVCLVMGAHCS